MKEKLMELEMLMRSVRAKMEEMEEMGVEIVSVDVSAVGRPYSINLYNAITEISDELGVDTEPDTSDDPDWRGLKVNHNGVMIVQWEYKADQYGFKARRAQ